MEALLYGLAVVIVGIIVFLWACCHGAKFERELWPDLDDRDGRF